MSRTLTTNLNNNTENNNTMNNNYSSIVDDPSWYIPYYLSKIEWNYQCDGSLVILSKIEPLRTAATEWICLKNPHRGNEYIDFIIDNEGNRKLVLRAFCAMYDNNTMIKRKISAVIRRYLRTIYKLTDRIQINMIIEAWWREEMKKEKEQ